ncbi:MAG: hypothetical protein ACOYCD_00880 [Kiritimatiellia bacterium]|jgi:hypothetical protein
MKLSHNLILMLTFTVGWASLCQAASELPDFSHYQIILDRKPFGEIAPVKAHGDDLAASGAGASASAQDLELRAIIEEGNTIRVGMFDRRDNSSFYIKQGETVDQFELVSVNYDAEEAVLRKMNETIVFKLRPGQDGDAAANVSGPSLQPSPAEPPVFSPPGGTSRPFFAELRRRREAASGTNPPAPRGFAEFFKQQQQTSTQAVSAVKPASPFGPFTPITNAGVMPFGVQPVAPPPGPPAFSPFQPVQPDQAEVVDVSPEVLQPSDGSEAQSFAPISFQPIQPVTE